MVFKKKRSLWELLCAFVRWLGAIAVVAAIELLIGILLLFC